MAVLVHIPQLDVDERVKRSFRDGSREGFALGLVIGIVATMIFVVLPSHAGERIKRDPNVIRAFKAQTICPSTGRYTQRCAGFEVDHRIPLACGGDDALHNLQYMTITAHDAKTLLDNRGCRLLREAAKGMVKR